MKAVLLLLVAVSCVYAQRVVAKPNKYATMKLMKKVMENKEMLLKANFKTYSEFVYRTWDMIKGQGIDTTVEELREKTIPLILAMTKNGFNSKQIFSQLKTSKIPYRFLQSNDSLMCRGCKIIVDVIKFDLDVMKMSAEKVKTLIETLCANLAPLKIQKKLCNDITDYIDNIIQWILNGTTPVDVCEQLKLCDDSISFQQKNVFNMTSSLKSILTSRKFRLTSLKSRLISFLKKVRNRGGFSLNRNSRPKHNGFRPSHHNKMRPRHHKFRPRPHYRRFRPQPSHYRHTRRHYSRRHFRPHPHHDRHHHHGRFHPHHRGRHTHHHHHFHPHHHGNHTHRGNHSHCHGNHSHHDGRHHHRHHHHHGNYKFVTLNNRSSHFGNYHNHYLTHYVECENLNFTKFEKSVESYTENYEYEDMGDSDSNIDDETDNVDLEEVKEEEHKEALGRRKFRPYPRPNRRHHHFRPHPHHGRHHRGHHRHHHHHFHPHHNHTHHRNHSHCHGNHSHHHGRHHHKHHHHHGNHTFSNLSGRSFNYGNYHQHYFTHHIECKDLNFTKLEEPLEEEAETYENEDMKESDETDGTEERFPEEVEDEEEGFPKEDHESDEDEDGFEEEGTDIEESSEDPENFDDNIDNNADFNLNDENVNWEEIPYANMPAFDGESGKTLRVRRNAFLRFATKIIGKQNKLPELTLPVQKLLGNFNKKFKLPSGLGGDFKKIMPKLGGDFKKIMPKFGGDYEKIMPKLGGDFKKIMPEFGGDYEKIMPKLNNEDTLGGDYEKIMPKLNNEDTLGGDYEKIMPKLNNEDTLGGDYEKIMPKLNNEDTLGGDYEKIMPKLKNEEEEDEEEDSTFTPEETNFPEEDEMTTPESEDEESTEESTTDEVDEEEKETNEDTEDDFDLSLLKTIFDVDFPDYEKWMKNTEKLAKRTIKEYKMTDFTEYPIDLKPMFKLLPENFKESMKKIISETEKATTNLKKEVEDGIGCTICKTVVTFVEWEVKTVNATIEDIEKAVKQMCKLYPIKAATEACDEIVENIDEVIQMIEKDFDSSSICEELKLCSTSKISVFEIMKQFTISSPTTECAPLCSFMKGIYKEDVMETAKLWTGSKERMMSFCKDNKIKVKCDRYIYIFAKAERQLSAVITKEDQTADDCKCFSNQPIFHMKKGNDVCQMCKQFEQGLTKDLIKVNETLEVLLESFGELCQQLPSVQTECNTILDDVRAAFSKLESKLNPLGICDAIGLCQNKPKIIKERIMKAMELFGGPNPFMVGGMPIGFSGTKENSESCKFCKECMGNLRKTFKHIDGTLETKETLPKVKEGLDIFCQSIGDGETITRVCKTIKDGMETVQKEISENRDVDGMCKMLDIC